MGCHHPGGGQGTPTPPRPHNHHFPPLESQKVEKPEPLAAPTLPKAPFWKLTAGGAAAVHLRRCAVITLHAGVRCTMVAASQEAATITGRNKAEAAQPILQRDVLLIQRNHGTGYIIATTVSCLVEFRFCNVLFWVFFFAFWFVFSIEVFDLLLLFVFFSLQSVC